MSGGAAFAPPRSPKVEVQAMSMNQVALWFGYASMAYMALYAVVGLSWFGYLLWKERRGRKPAVP